MKISTSNDITLVVSTKENGIVFDEDCCTCVNVILTNDGKIATSFLGTHNPYIISQLEKAYKEYFKALKRKLKKDYNKNALHINENDADIKNTEGKNDNLN